MPEAKIFYHVTKDANPSPETLPSPLPIMESGNILCHLSEGEYILEVTIAQGEPKTNPEALKELGFNSCSGEYLVSDYKIVASYPLLEFLRKQDPRIWYQPPPWLGMGNILGGIEKMFGELNFNSKVCNTTSSSSSGASSFSINGLLNSFTSSNFSLDSVLDSFSGKKSEENKFEFEEGSVLTL